MPSKARVAVVIPNWNGEDYIIQCLHSLEKQALKPHVLVVDNCSEDNSVALIRNHFPKVELVELSTNTGFAGGVNTGISLLLDTYEYIALFNNDAVADTDWLHELVDVLDKHPKVGIATGKLIRIDKKHLDSTGDFYSIWGMPFPRGRNQRDDGQFDTQEYVFAASGGASLYRSEALNDIGLFDENFFAYYEDVDISFRAQLAGWKVFYTPKAIAWHHVSATSNRLGTFTRYHSTKNFYLLYVKNMPGVLFWKYFPLVFVQGLRLFASSIFRGGLVAYLKGHGKAVLLLPSTLKKRSVAQKKRRVAVRYIDSLLYKQRPPKIPRI